MIATRPAIDNVPRLCFLALDVKTQGPDSSGPIPRRTWILEHTRGEPSLFYSLELISLDYSTAYPGQIQDATSFYGGVSRL